MSVAEVSSGCVPPAPLVCLELAQQQEVAMQKRKEEVEVKASFDIWGSIQDSKRSSAADEILQPYVHPMLRRPSHSLSQKSLELCTESLGSETGSDAFSDSNYSSEESEEEEFIMIDSTPIGGWERKDHEKKKKQLAAVNYHCSSNKTCKPTKLFPPPLPSISRRDGPCVQMRHHREGGRLVLRTAQVPSQNYLHCQREGGRLLLSFIETTFEDIYPEIEDPVVKNKQEAIAILTTSDKEYEGEVEEIITELDEEDEMAEEVEVVDRGIVVEVKVSSLPQLQRGGMQVRRSSLVINKFVSGTPMIIETPTEEAPTWYVTETKPAAKSSNMATLDIVPVVTTTTSEMDWWGSGQPSSAGPLNKRMFSSKKMMNRQDLLHQVRRCSDHHSPLFIWEPCCIATT